MKAVEQVKRETREDTQLGWEKQFDLAREKERKKGEKRK